MNSAERDPKEITVIPSISDKVADASNLAAIDSLIGETEFPYIVAWGKWLGFTPASIQTTISQARADGTSKDVIQKIDGRWLVIDDIANSSNRQQVKEIAAKGREWSR